MDRILDAVTFFYLLVEYVFQLHRAILGQLSHCLLSGLAGDNNRVFLSWGATSLEFG